MQVGIAGGTLKRDEMYIVAVIRLLVVNIRYVTTDSVYYMEDKRLCTAVAYPGTRCYAISPNISHGSNTCTQEIFTHIL